MALLKCVKNSHFGGCTGAKGRAYSITFHIFFGHPTSIWHNVLYYCFYYFKVLKFFGGFVLFVFAPHVY